MPLHTEKKAELIDKFRTHDSDTGSPEVQIVHDNNGTRVVRDPTEGTASLRVYQSADRVGAGLSLQARF